MNRLRDGYAAYACQPLAMNFCGFCGKGPFPLDSGLKKHIRLSVNCNKAAHQEWENHTKNMWDNSSEPPDTDQQPPPEPPILEDEELANLQDITLEDDLLALEDGLANTMGPPPDTPPANEIPPDQGARLRATVQDAEEGDNEIESTLYIEDFPEDLGAGAILGEEEPFFQTLRREQEESGSSWWGPFEDQDEWELGQWLIRNTGHNQTNALLNLNIVSSHRFFRDH